MGSILYFDWSIQVAALGLGRSIASAVVSSRFQHSEILIYCKVLSSGQAMRAYTLLLVLAVLAVSYSSAIPKPDGDKKDRTKEKTLSEQDHEDHGEHNNNYDHDAFLGKDDAKTFDQLSPEESQDRLGLIVDKIDKDGNGFVTEEELKEWIQYVQKRYIITDTDRMWKDHEPDADDKLLWTSYKKRTYGYPDEPEEGSPTYEYRDMIQRDKRRWEKADKDRDSKLSKEEFMDFLHPEDAEHMREIVVHETLEDIDKDKDGFISIEEYIGDMWPDKDKGEEEPEWVKSEREQFNTYRDKNKDGKMDGEEVREWILPSDYDHSRAETKHLIHEADADKDGKLTKEEILDKYDLFVGSQATDFGEALTRHDEF
ncbi:calumenin-B-like isoform X2 [Haliotis rufescens]|uniref:calumenin-B-like isoform X2 n=1 Tax=Haliotis rufescens TaxID=6454 RepID=UPI00201F0A54|nr:calumenin-B-like isoform X2 [Haliotis rufescens]